MHSDATRSPSLSAAPAQVADALWRQRVVDRLRLAPPASARLSFLAAPAGFGKTTALAQWAEQHRRAGGHVAWMNCDERHKDADFFAEGLLAAVLQALPAGADAPKRGLPLARCLAQWPGQWLLCVDEFEAASGAAVDALVEQLAYSLPDALSLVLASRQAPGRGFTRLELSGRARLVDAELLRFTREEALQLLGGALPDAAAAQLVNYADGWPFALQLARLRARSESGTAAPGWELDPRAKIPRRQIFDYLADEVIASLPPSVVSFLGEVAVLDVVDVAAANALRKASDSLGLIRQLRRLSPIVTLDDSLQRARLHPLLRDYLSDAMELAEPGRVAQLHLRAARHLVDCGQLHQAVAHALNGGRLDLAADIIEQAGGIRLVANEGALRSRLLLQQLPEATIRRRPRLRLMQLGWQVGDIEPGTASAEFERIEQQMHDADGGASEADLLDLEAGRCVMLVNESARQLDFSPWAALTRAGRLARANAAMDRRPLAIVLAIDIFMLHRYGPIDRCERRTNELTDVHAGGAYTFNSPWIWMYHARTALARADLPKAEHHLRHWLVNDANYINYRQDSIDQLATVLLGRIAHERGQLATALAHFSSLQAERPSMMFEVLHGAHVQAAACEFALGNAARAMEMLAATRQMAYDEELSHLALSAGALQTELAARMGDQALAQRLVDDTELLQQWQAAQQPFARPWLLVQALARAVFELRLLQHDAAAALQVANSLQLLAQQTGHRLGELNAQWLQLRAGLLLDASARAALPELDAAIAASAACEAVQLALDGGTTMVLQLRGWLGATRLPEDHPQRLWVQHTLALWEAGFRQRAQRVATGTLTPREVDVLCELAQERSTKLIARKLLLSPETVKHHLKGIYAKLQVGARDEAVAVARQRGLIA